MTRSEFADLVAAMTDEEWAVLAKAEKEYAHDQSDVLAHCAKTAAHIHCRNCSHPLHPLQVAMVFKLKHVYAMVAHANGHEAQREPIEGRVTDDRGWSAIFRGIVEDARPNRPAATPADDDAVHWSIPIS